MATLEGIDVSSYQGYVDWQWVKHGGKSFAFIKATEGSEYKDPTFPHNWNSCAYRGIERVAYHFWYDNIDPIGQSDFYHSYVRNSGRFSYGDGICVDVEEVSITGYPNPVDRLIEFINRCRSQINKQVIIYTNYDTWVNKLGNPVRDELKNRPLWLADYGPYIPHIDQWPSGLAFWQYSESGHCPGVLGNVDLDRFFGNMGQLKRLLRATP